MTQTINDNLLVNGHVLIDSTADAKQLRVQAHTSQTNPLQSWETAGGTDLARMTGDGRLQVGTLGLGGVPAALVEANDAITLPSSRPLRGVQALGRTSGTLADPINWSVHELELQGTGGTTSVHAGLRGRLTHSNTGNAQNAELRAGDFEARNESGTSSVRVGRLAGLRGVAVNTGYLTKAVGVEASIANAVGGDISEAAAFEVSAPTNAGTLNILYGLRIPDLTQATTNLAIQTGQGVVRLGDHEELKVFTSTPTGNPPANYIKVYPKLAGGNPRLYAKDAAGIEYDLTGVSAAFAVHGRLTLTAGTAINTADVSSGTTLYFTPHNGNQVGLYDGSKWVLYTFTERSLSLSSLTASTNYDVFLYDNAGILTLETVAWTNNTTRATPLAKQDGVYVKSGATRRRYLGTLRTRNTPGESQDSAAARLVWNYYNRVRRSLVKSNYTSHTYTTNAWRAWNNGTAETVEYVIGVVEEPLSVTLGVEMQGAGTNGFVGLSPDGATPTQPWVAITADLLAASTSRLYQPTAGYHYFQIAEYGNSPAVTFYNYQLNGNLGG